MLYTENVPIDVFLSLCMTNQKVTSMTAGWRIENSRIEKMLLQHFREMGVFLVAPLQQKIIMEAVIRQLKTSPEIRNEVRKAEQSEAMKRQSRHAEG